MALTPKEVGRLNPFSRSSRCGSVVKEMRMWVWYLDSLSGLRIQPCCELWCRLKTQLGSYVAGSIQLLAWQLPYASGAALRRPNKQTKHLFSPNSPLGALWHNRPEGPKVPVEFLESILLPQVRLSINQLLCHLTSKMAREGFWF